jgi:MFS family permease
LRRILRDPLILPIYVPTMLLAFAMGALTPILPIYVAEFSTSYGLIGLVIAGNGIGALIGDMPAGMIIRRLGRLRGIWLGLLIAAIPTVALFWARSVPEALLYRLISGFGWALMSVARHSYLTSVTSPDSRGRAISLFGGVTRIGNLAGPVTGGAIAAAFGLRMPFLLFGAACALGLFVLGLSLRNGHEPEEAIQKKTTSHKQSFLEVVKANRNTFATAGTGQLFAIMIRAGRRVIIPLFAADMLGLDPASIGVLVSASWAVDTALFYPAGLIMDRLGRKWAIVPCFLIQSVGMALVPLSSGFAGLLAATLLIGFGNGLGSGTMMTLGADLAPEETQGEFLGIWQFIGSTGRTTSPLVVGGIADAVTLPMATWVIAACGMTAGLIFAFLVPETLETSRVRSIRPIFRSPRR